jgi:glycosyltransferase involved in cell wall biosynthesis
MKHLSVFLPFHNEEGNIEAAVKAVLGALWQILDDGSTDRTKEIALEIVRENAQVRLVSHDTNRGYGAAIMSGFNDARFEYVFFTDGDLQFDISELRDFLPWVPEYGAVIGYRVKRQDNLQRRINTFLWNRFIRAMFGLKVRDIDCAFKLFKTDLVADLPMISGGAMFSAELLMRQSTSRFTTSITKLIDIRQDDLVSE